MSSSHPKSSDRATTLWHLWARASFRHPLLILLPLAVVTGVALVLAADLRLRPELSRFLPESQPSVRGLEKLARRMPGASNAFIVLEGDDRAALRRFGDALASKLNAMGAPLVTRAETGVHETRAFLQPRIGLFASLEDLASLRDELIERRRRAYATAFGADLWEDEAALPPINAERLAGLVKGHGLLSRHREGYYESEDGRTLVVVVRSEIAPDDLNQAAIAVASLTKLAREGAEALGIRVALAGDLVTGLTEYKAIRDDLLSIGALGLGAVLMVIVLYYVSLRPLLLLGATILTGCAWSFGFTRLTVGELNTATGFMFSIVAGNGINFGIILLSRHLEERRRGLTTEAALAMALTNTWRPTLAAALAAASAYIAMAFTDFKGFRDMAVIGGGGMLLCWMATFATLPAWLVVAERLMPLVPARADGAGLLGRMRGALHFKVPFAALVERWPRVLASTGALAAILAAGATWRYLAGDPLEYNMRKLETDKRLTARVYQASEKAVQILGNQVESAMVVLTDRLDQVQPYQSALRERRDRAPADQVPFEDATSIYDFVPGQQAEKIPVLAEIRKLIVQMRNKNAIEDDDWRKLEPLLPPAQLEPYTMNDLPEAIKLAFRERDGTLGRVVYVTPAVGQSDKDIRYLLRFAEAYRSTTLPNGDTVEGSGRAVLFADLIGAVVASMVPSLSFALLGLSVVVLVSFRRLSEGLQVMACLLIGLLWLGAAMAAAGIRLNFINFSALPITLGIGADYAINMAHRYREAGRGGRGAKTALRGVAGPVVLCSLTTTLAYLALVASRNHAIRGLGLVAVLGEITCLLAATLLLPAYWLWRAGVQNGGKQTDVATSNHSESPRPIDHNRAASPAALDAS